MPQFQKNSRFVVYKLTFLNLNIIYCAFEIDTHYILCYYNHVFKFLCYLTSGVWTIPPEHTRV